MLLLLRVSRPVSGKTAVEFCTGIAEGAVSGAWRVRDPQLPWVSRPAPIRLPEPRTPSPVVTANHWAPGMCEVLFTAPHHLRTNKQPFKETAVTTPGAEIGKLSHGAFNLLAEGHRARGWQSWGVKLGSVALSPHLGLPVPPSPSQVPVEQVWEAETRQGLPWRGCP